MGILTLTTPMFRPLKAIFNSPQSYAQEKSAILFWVFSILQNPFPFRCLLNFGTINSQPGPNMMYGVDNINDLFLGKKSPKN
jgi:hypothetical protein